ncbi:MAG: hypothetical protein ACFFDW_14645 [Candidatus Thorarchaeota archaeon]
MSEENNGDIIEGYSNEDHQRLQSFATFSFYFGIITILLFSWLFHLVLWRIMEIADSMIIVYLVFISLFAIAGIIIGIFSRKTKRGIFGLVVHACVLCSYLISIILYYTL